jgi:esterase/lipase
MRRIICLSGWGQSFDSIELSLNDDIKESHNIVSLDYLKFPSFNHFVNSIKLNYDPIAIIGWSLGGQLALRLCELKIFDPQILFLIAPPFQMVKDEKIQAGMSLKVYHEFYNNLQIVPSATLKKFTILSIMNDKNRNEIMANIKSEDSKDCYLIYWLEELKKFTCFNIDFTKIPSCRFFIGNGDMIVHPLQVQYFKDRIIDCEINYFANCGHAPHLNDNQRFNKIIIDELNKVIGR